MKVFNAKEFTTQILADLKNEVSKFSFVPEFSDILVGTDGPSVRYVKMKAKTAESIGIKFVDGTLPENATTQEIIEKINELSMRPNMCGIIVQLPLPENIDTEAVLNAVPLNLDVDGLSQKYSDVFYNTSSFENILIMPTVLAIKKILDFSTWNNFRDKNIAIVGQGRLVGKPTAHLLKSFTNNIQTIDKNTAVDKRNEILKNADIVITAVGKPGIIIGDDVKQNVIVIDAGTLEVENVLLGDVDFETVSDKASFITKTPGGVGPVTVASLMENLVRSAKQKHA